jgi:hypothetical protein
LDVAADDDATASQPSDNVEVTFSIRVGKKNPITKTATVINGIFQLDGGRGCSDCRTSGGIENCSKHKKYTDAYQLALVTSSHNKS